MASAPAAQAVQVEDDGPRNCSVRATAAQAVDVTLHRRAIADLLTGHPHVARFKPAPQDQGGAGATIVELKQ